MHVGMRSTQATKFLLEKLKASGQLKKLNEDGKTVLNILKDRKVLQSEGFAGFICLQIWTKWLVLLKTVEKLQEGLIIELSNHKLTVACYIASTEASK